MKRGKVEVLDATDTVIEIGSGLQIGSTDLVPAVREKLQKAVDTAKSKGMSIMFLLFGIIVVGWIAGVVLNLLASLFAIAALLVGTAFLASAALIFGPKLLQNMQIAAREMEIETIKAHSSTFIELFVLPAFQHQFDRGQEALSKYKAAIDGDLSNLERNYRSGNFTEDFYREQLQVIEGEKGKIPEIENGVKLVGEEVRKWSQILAQTRFLEGRADSKREINSALVKAFGSGIENQNGEIAISSAIAKSAEATASLDTTLKTLVAPKLRMA